MVNKEKKQKRSPITYLELARGIPLLEYSYRAGFHCRFRIRLFHEIIVQVC